MVPFHLSNLADGWQKASYVRDEVPYPRFVAHVDSIIALKLSDDLRGRQGRRLHKRGYRI